MTLHPHDDAGHAMYEEQHSAAPDPNPFIECDGGCGESYPWRDYWKPRVNQMENPRKQKWYCDDCKARKRKMERIRRYNRQLGEFRDG